MDTEHPQPKPKTRLTLSRGWRFINALVIRPALIFFAVFGAFSMLFFAEQGVNVLDGGAGITAAVAAFTSITFSLMAGVR